MPDSPNAADTLAWAYIVKGTYGLAIDLLQDALKQQPNNATYEYHLGLAYQKQKNIPKALEHYKKALEIDPKFSQADDARKALGQLKG
jgi:tetratricopeptide (TPR) repeat protein